jgi:hypothetical protein
MENFGWSKKKGDGGSECANVVKAINSGALKCRMARSAYYN